MSLFHSKNSWTLIPIAMVVFVVGMKMCPTPKEKTVDKSHTKERVVTIIKERPDGSKETTIIENRDTKQSHIETKHSSPKWAIGASVGTSDWRIREPIYGVRVERYIFESVSVGLYGRTNGDFGISGTISF